MEWIDVNICNSASCNVFNKVILKIIRPKPSQVLNIDSSEGLKFLTRIWFGLSHLADHKFRQNSQDCINPICSWSQEIETSTHFLLHCFNYDCARQTLFEKVSKVDSIMLKQNDQVITKPLPFGNEKLRVAQKNQDIQNLII